MIPRDLAIGIMIALAVLVLLTMLFAWRRRLRRDSVLVAPLGVPEHAEVLDRREVLYVSTTRHHQPLERLTLSPLAYRARGEAAVTDRGLALCLDGAPTVFVASDLRLTQGDIQTFISELQRLVTRRTHDASDGTATPDTGATS